jgi:tetratricopeptide (TPR) repeat protein
MFSALGARYAVAQDRTGLPGPDNACIDLNQTALNYIAVGHLKDAESTLSPALTDLKSGSKQKCGWRTLHNLATVMALSGRLAEAEVLEKRSLTILEKSYPPDHPFLLRPLQSLAQIQFEEGEIGRARETRRRLQSIRTERPGEGALVHSTAAALLYAEGRYKEAEAEYLKALDEWEQAGRGKTTDVAAVLSSLAALYLADGRYREAVRTLDRAGAVLASAKDAVPMDWMKFLSIRAALHVRQGEWRQAEADFRGAVSAADRETRMDSAPLKTLLANYAYVLRKNHRGKEARSIEVRAAAVQPHGLRAGVVDISELLAGRRKDQK